MKKNHPESYYIQDGNGDLLTGYIQGSSVVHPTELGFSALSSLITNEINKEFSI